MKNKKGNKKEKELPSEILSSVRDQLYETYKYLGEVVVKGHQNSKIMGAVFDSLFKSVETLNELQEEIMNFEGLKNNIIGENDESENDEK